MCGYEHECASVCENMDGSVGQYLSVSTDMSVSMSVSVCESMDVSMSV